MDRLQTSKENAKVYVDQINARSQNQDQQVQNLGH